MLSLTTSFTWSTTSKLTEPDQNYATVYVYVYAKRKLKISIIRNLISISLLVKWGRMRKKERKEEALANGYEFSRKTWRRWTGTRALRSWRRGLLAGKFIVSGELVSEVLAKEFSTGLWKKKTIFFFFLRILGAFLCEAEVKMMEWLESCIYRESDEVKGGRRRSDADVDVRHVEHTCQVWCCESRDRVVTWT